MRAYFHRRAVKRWNRQWRRWGKAHFEAVRASQVGV